MSEETVITEEAMADRRNIVGRRLEEAAAQKLYLDTKVDELKDELNFWDEKLQGSKNS